MSIDQVTAQMRAEGAIAYCVFVTTRSVARFWRYTSQGVETQQWYGCTQGQYSDTGKGWGTSMYSRQEIEAHLLHKQWIKL